MEMNLTSEELTNPFLALEKIFDNHKVSEIEMLLNEVQEQLFDKSYSHTKDSIAHDNTVFFFEQIHKLARASFLLHKKYTRLLAQRDEHELDWFPN
jgi:hypothetical protein